jgi:hypothetical protein
MEINVKPLSTEDLKAHAGLIQQAINKEVELRKMPTIPRPPEWRQTAYTAENPINRSYFIVYTADGGYTCINMAMVRVIHFYPDGSVDVDGLRLGPPDAALFQSVFNSIYTSPTK